MSYWKRFVEFLVSSGSGVRAKDAKGRFVADDKSTDDVNEAYADGKNPKPKSTSTKPRNLRKPRKTRQKSKGSRNKK
tara:strand:+ start:77 stop:307 length:231 start_codon:yes stop_codon:yes gene_type:complete